MFTTIRKQLQNRRDRRVARARYDDHAWFLGSLLWSDEEWSDRDHRIANLGHLAFTAGAMARECLIFDNKRTCEDGYTPAQWHQAEASLFLLLEAAEKGDYSEVELDYTALSLWMDPKIDGLLNDLANTAYLDVKAHVLLALHTAVTPYVGGQAAEVLAALADVYFISAGMTNKEAHRIVWGKAEAK